MNESPEVPNPAGNDSAPSPDSRATSLSRVIHGIVVVERSLAGLMLILIVGTMGAQVIARYWFGMPFSWSEEIARLAMIWLTFIAASYVMAEGNHIAVDLWSAKVSDRLRLWLDGAVHLAVAATCLLLFGGGIRFVLFVHPVGSPSLGIPKSLWYGAVSVGLLLMALHSLLNLTLLIRTGKPFIRSPFPEDEGFHLEMKVETKANS